MEDYFTLFGGVLIVLVIQEGPSVCVRKGVSMENISLRALRLYKLDLP